MANRGVQVIASIVLVGLTILGGYHYWRSNQSVSAKLILEEYQDFYHLEENRYLGDKGEGRLDLIQLDGDRPRVDQSIDYISYFVIPSQVIIFDQAGVSAYSTRDFSKQNQDGQYILGNLDGDNIYLDQAGSNDDDTLVRLDYRLRGELVGEELVTSLEVAPIFANIGTNHYRLVFDQLTATLAVTPIDKDFEASGQTVSYNNVKTWRIEQDYLAIDLLDDSGQRFVAEDLLELNTTPLIGLCVDYQLGKDYLYLDYKTRLDLPAEIDNQSKVYCHQDNIYIWLGQKLYEAKRDEV
ncbi:hypothetical protein KC853_02675 [Candidatus Saccharibacteria bacterium]|nr:hypothetical protein [Candidatus Saccharibacteria bacterium]MCB9834606.1 hypothetical protein [Candidatus Nomurabacteria bacterium]